ncbi:ABC transporter substrate-binding protein [Tsukamurella soli]|uniref:ABC transporter substrate-binding protein n=3 Tax=Tsukamurella soli TaxID=644556 RepID=A0ABP8KDF5_9ACTN
MSATEKPTVDFWVELPFNRSEVPDMHKLIGVAAVAVVASATITACGSGGAASPQGCSPAVGASDLVHAGTLTISTNATLPPMQYVDANGNVTGMRIDIGDEIAKRLCLKPDFVNVDFDAQIPGVQGKRWDMIDTGLFYTPERAQTLDLVPYERQAVAVAVPKGDPRHIAAVDDLAGKTIGVEAPGYEFDTLNSLAAKFATEGKPKLTVRGFQTNADAFQALAAGQVDGAAIVDSVTTYYEKDGRFTTAVGGINPAPLAMGFAKHSPISAVVAKTLSQMRADGWLTAVFKKYGVQGYQGNIAVSTGSLGS